MNEPSSAPATRRREQGRIPDLDRASVPPAWLDDVYASAPLHESAKAPATTITLRLMAAPDPTFLPRVAALLGNIGVVPAKLNFLLLTEDLAMVTIELHGMAEHSVGLLQRKLASLPQCMAQASFSTGSRSHLLPAEDWK